MDSAILNRQSPGTLDLLLSRRSGSAKAMTEPGPSPDQINVLLRATSRVPDHGKLFPWRFIVFEGEARRRMGDVLAECLIASESQATPDRLEQERGRFLRAPV